MTPPQTLEQILEEMQAREQAATEGPLFYLYMSPEIAIICYLICEVIK